jgi:hypothetical protein
VSTLNLLSMKFLLFSFTDDIIVYAPKKLSNKFEDDALRYDGNYDTDKIKKFLSQEM